MIGIDAASLPFIEAHGAELPVLRRLLASGVLHHLRPRRDLITGAQWPDFFTGEHPGMHGYYHDLAWDPTAMRVRRVTDRAVAYAPFWHRFDAVGLAVIAVDVPHALPPRPRRGVEVVAWNAHDHMTPFGVHPVELRREIRRRFGGRSIGYETPARKTTRQMAGIRQRLIESARRKGDLCRWLLRQHQWDFFVTVFGEPHRGGHLLWPHALPDLAPPPPGALLDVYRAVDTAIGQILDALRAAGAMVAIFAANGMGEDISQDHLALPIMDRVNELFLAHEGIAPVDGAIPGRSLVRRLRARLPDRIQHALGQVAPVWVRDQIVSRTFTDGRDWRRTPGFAVRSDVHTYVRYNLRGRESAGMLEPGSALLARYEAWLARSICSLRDADTGEPVVREVCFSRHAYPGPRMHLLPDAIVAYRDLPPASRLASELLGEIDAELGTGRCGNHRPDGFCLLLEPTGDWARAGALTHVSDLAPMLLRHYGVAPLPAAVSS
ncbi:MAG: alkaline phosphatase family protein [Candidatus Binatia bacterium]